MTDENKSQVSDEIQSRSDDTPTASAPKLTRKIIVLDVIERVFVIGLFVNFVLYMFGKNSDAFNIVILLIVVSETLPVLLMSLRGPSPTMTTRLDDWFVGFAGGALPLMAIAPQGSSPVPMALVAIIMLSGMAFQIYGKLSLGRSFGVVAANRGVKVQGAYRFVRHPIYAGYTITHIGFLMMYPYLQNFIVYGVALAFQITRMDREERVLLQDQAYQMFAQTTRYRLMPGVY